MEVARGSKQARICPSLILNSGVCIIKLTEMQNYPGPPGSLTRVFQVDPLFAFQLHIRTQKRIAYNNIEIHFSILT